MVERAHAGFHGRARFAAHIDFARRILPDQHDGEPGHQAMRPRQPPRVFGDARAQVRRNRLAVDDARAHALPAAFSSAGMSVAGLPSSFTRLIRALAPAAMLTSHGAMASMSASSRTRALLASPSLGAART